MTITYFTPRGEVQQRYLLPLGLFLFSVVFFLPFLVSLAPDLRSAKKYLPVIFVRLAFIRQHFHESWRRKSLAIGWHKNPFVENKNEDASEL